MLPCAYKQIFGISCPLCGFQRSVKCLFNGDYIGCIKMFPPLIFMFIVMIITIATYLKKKTFDTKFVKNSWWFLLILLAMNCIYQNIVVKWKSRGIASAFLLW